MALTVKGCARLTRRGRYLDEHGLYLQVHSPTNRSWLLRYELNGKKRWMGLGSAATFSLAEARERARQARQLLADGLDPLELRRAERIRRQLEAARNKTFAVVAQEYYDAHAASWSNVKHRQQFLNTLTTYAYQTLGELPVATIDEPMVLAVLQPIWASKTVTAKRVRNRIAAVLDFATAAGYRKGTNPARWEGHLEHLLAAPDKIARVSHHGALPYRELPTFMAELSQQQGVAARALEFTILTAVRTGETLGARWSEIDLQAKIWSIPAARMKAARPHQVPLVERVVALLQALPRDPSDVVFVGACQGGEISNVGMYRALRRMGRDGITVHGFRSTFRDWCAEQTAVPNRIAEMALAHQVGSEVERAYLRSDLFDKRARLMQLWAQFCSQPARAAEVVPLRAVP
jgi:integrase